MAMHVCALIWMWVNQSIKDNGASCSPLITVLSVILQLSKPLEPAPVHGPEHVCCCDLPSTGPPLVAGTTAALNVLYSGNIDFLPSGLPAPGYVVAITVRNLHPSDACTTSLALQARCMQMNEDVYMCKRAHHGPA